MYPRPPGRKRSLRRIPSRRIGATARTPPRPTRARDSEGHQERWKGRPPASPAMTQGRAVRVDRLGAGQVAPEGGDAPPGRATPPSTAAVAPRWTSPTTGCPSPPAPPWLGPPAPGLDVRPRCPPRPAPRPRPGGPTSGGTPGARAHAAATTDHWRANAVLPRRRNGRPRCARGPACTRRCPAPRAPTPDGASPPSATPRTRNRRRGFSEARGVRKIRASRKIHLPSGISRRPLFEPEHGSHTPVRTHFRGTKPRRALVLFRWRHGLRTPQAVADTRLLRAAHRLELRH